MTALLGLLVLPLCSNAHPGCHQNAYPASNWSAAAALLLPCCAQVIHPGRTPKQGQAAAAVAAVAAAVARPPLSPALGEAVVRFQVADHMLEDGQVRWACGTK